MVDRGGGWRSAPRCGATRAASIIRSRSRNCSTSIGRWARARNAKASATSWSTDMDRVVPDPQKSIREGAIAPWNAPAYAHELEELLALADDYKLPVDVPFAELTDEQRRLIVGRRAGAKLRRPERLLPLAGAPQVQDAPARVFEPLAIVSSLPGLRRSAAAARGARRARGRQELCRRVRHEDSRRARVSSTSCNCPSGSSRSPGRSSTMCGRGWRTWSDVGVGYLALDRPLRTLSGGEAQRVALTATLGSSLVDMLYVLDEPSVGLHPADVEPLAAAIEQLQRSRQHGRRRRARRGNHSPGRSGRRIRPRRGRATAGGSCFKARRKNWRSAKDSRTGDWLAGRAATRRRRAPHRPRKVGSSCAAHAATICKTSPSSFRSACCAW